MRNILIALTLMLSANIDVSAQGTLKPLTLEELNYGGKRYWQTQPKNRTLVWWGNQLVEPGVNEVMLINHKTGETNKLFTLEQINAVLGEDAKVRSLQYVSFPYENESVVLLQKYDEYVLIDWQTNRCVARFPNKETQASDFTATGKALAVVESDNLFVERADGTKDQLTTDGSREIVYGQVVHRNEFGIDKGTFWSPDGKKLAFYRMDQSMVTDYPLVDIDTRIATEVPEKYPMAGEASHKVTVGVYDLDNKQTIYLNVGDPTDRYFTNIQWSPDSKTLYLIELNRDQTDMSLDAYNPVSGEKLKTLYTEHCDKYVHPVTPITFLPWDATQFIFQTERSGYNHLMLMNVEGEEIKTLTDGDFVVIDLVGFCTKTKSVIITSTEAHPLQNNIYKVDVKTAARTLLDNGEGVHHALLSADGTMLVDRYSSPTMPRCINLISSIQAKGKKVNEPLNLLTATDSWAGYIQPIIESGSIKAADGKTDLYYRMVKPSDFDVTKKYPTVVYVYGGPGTRNVQYSWHYSLRGWEAYMASKGYVLFILDNRGSSDRGREFEQATFRHLGVEEMKDQICGVEFLKTLPYVDANRLGVHGWSFGGFMTTSLMTTYPDVFKVGVAGGPVIDWKFYEVMYGERYMDTPQTNPEGYEETSLLNKAKNLKGKLQIITGMNDPVVLPQHCLSFLRECIAAGTQPDFFVYPGEPHNMRGRQSYHLHERITQYFEDYLK